MTERDRINPVVTIAVACLATVMLMLDISVINTALSKIAHGLDTGLSGLQWVVDAYTIPLAATVLTAGAIADRFGRRKLFLLGLAIFTASSALCGAASGIEMLVAARAVQGLGASMMFATALALISQVTPDVTSRTKALAAYGAAIGASFALGPFIGGSLTALFGWRAIFLVNVPIGVAVLWITYRGVAEGRDPTPRRVDVPGQITLIGGLFLLVLALLRGNVDGWGSAGVIAALAGAALLLVGFVVVEARSREPMLPLRLLGAAPFRRPTDRGVRDRVVVLRGVPVPHALLADGAGPVADRDRARLPSWHVPGVRHLGDDGPVRGEVRPGQDREPGPGARRRWRGRAAGRRRGLLMDGAAARPAGDEHRHWSFQPDRERAGSPSPAVPSEWSGRGRERHLPPDRCGSWNRGAGNAGASRRGPRRRTLRLRRRTPPRADCERRDSTHGCNRNGASADPGARIR